jgi:hypothetical protein
VLTIDEPGKEKTKTKRKRGKILYFGILHYRLNIPFFLSFGRAIPNAGLLAAAVLTATGAGAGAVQTLLIRAEVPREPKINIGMDISRP